MPIHLLGPLQVPQSQHLPYSPNLWLPLHQSPEFVAGWIRAMPLSLEVYNAKVDKSPYNLGAVQA